MTPPDGRLDPREPIPLRTLPGFARDEVVAGRFRILRLLGEGGMGVVFEAEDLTLHGRVALKVVRPDLERDARGRERLLREVHLARKVTHPNVCRIFDVFQHAAVGGEVTVVTMELLSGETLAERLRRSGPMTEAEALPIVQQIVSGMAAAHEAGVIHRDLKSANVVLARSGAEETALRAVVADFGLARGNASAGGDASLTASGLVVGTPGYMSPEQIAGREVTAASDIYALGMVMYEMVTGRLPFPGDSVADAARRLDQAPHSPREQAPGLDPRWEAVILRCLERDPIDRFAAVGDVARALAGEEVAPGRRSLIAHRARIQRWRRLGLGLGVVTLLALGAAAIFLRPLPPGARTPSAGQVKLRRAVAVLGFKNLSGRPEAAWLSTALAEMLTAELAAGEGLRMVPGESVARTKLELALPDVDTLAKDTLARVRTGLGADLVVLGSYFAAGKEAGGKLRLDLRLQDTTAGETLAAVTDAGSEAELLDLVSRTGARLREKLGVGGLSASETGGVRAALPAGPEVARLYAEGLGRLRLFDALAARDLLQKAVAADPTSPLAHSALSAAWSALGYDARAKEEARSAFDLAASLTREERLLVEGRYREAAKEWDKAVDTYGLLWGFFPDNLEYGLRLAGAQTAAGKGKDALATLEALRRLSRPVADDPRIDLAEARAAEALSDYRRCQAAAARAAEKGTALGARLLVAEAGFQESRAFSSLGQPGNASAAAEEARRIFAEIGDRAGVARALNSSAVVLFEHGEPAQAKATFHAALAIAREIGNRDLARRALNNIAVVLVDVEGDLDGARTTYQESLAIAREIGEKRGMAIVLVNLAVILQQRADLSGAKAMAEQSLAIGREIGDRRRVADALNNIAEALRLQGDMAGARSSYEEALAIRRDIGHKRESAITLRDLGGLLAVLDERARARSSYEEALSLQTQLGEKHGAAQTRAALAELCLEEGRAVEAETLVRQALDEFLREKRKDDESLAQAILGRSLLAQEKLAAAREAMGRARGLSIPSQNLVLRLSLAIAGARLDAAAGDPGEGRRALEAVLAEAHKLGLVGHELEARLALGEIELRSASPAVGRARLETLQRDAAARGFRLIARKAREARP